MKSVRTTAPVTLNLGQGEPLRIMCADDDYAIRLVLKCALEKEGYHVECAEDGPGALSRMLADGNAFDLVITDHDMPPNFSGLCLVEKLRTGGFSGKIIVHSSELREADLNRYRSLGVDRILTKPVSWPEMRAAIQSLFEDAS